MRKAKIVCTLGPASDSVEVLTAMVRAGMNVARLNFSHGEHDEHRRRVDRIRAISRKLGEPVAILQDLQGPKIRLGQFVDGHLHVREGETVTVTTRKVLGRDGIIPTPVQSLPKDVRPGDPILLDDGRVRLQVRRVKGREVTCTVVVGGVLKDRKGLNLPGALVSISAITPKDEADLAFGMSLGVDYVALSFVRTARDVTKARTLMGARAVPIIAKIEKPQAVENLDQIAAVADGVMIARGDLGVEVPLETLPLIQKRAVQKVNALGRLVIVATEMLESMVQQPRPTRAEVSDVANAVLDGADAVMLSAETAVGAHPVEAVETMSRIVLEAEKGLPSARRVRPFLEGQPISTGVAAAAAAAADQLRSCVVAYTESGNTARQISELRPQVEILGLTPNEDTWRRMALYWGVRPMQVGRLHSTDAMVRQVKRLCRTREVCAVGQPVVIVAGVPLNQPGKTNTMSIHRV